MLVMVVAGGVVAICSNCGCGCGCDGTTVCSLYFFTRRICVPALSLKFRAFFSVNVMKSKQLVEKMCTIRCLAAIYDAVIYANYLSRCFACLFFF